MNTNQTAGTTRGEIGLGENEMHSIQTYLSDMISLERHIHTPVEHQAKDTDDFGKFPTAAQTVQRIWDLTKSHQNALQQRLEALGGHEANAVKKTWSHLLGFGAAAIDEVRKTKVSKALRDDYTALALASIGYTMLESTAKGLGDQQTAQLAQRLLKDYADCVVAIGKIMPTVVLEELRADGERVDTTAADEARQNADKAWQSSG